MDGDWTRSTLAAPGQSGENAKKVTTINEYPSNSKTALRQLGKKKPQIGNVQTKIPVAQQGTGPFGNEYDPSRTFPALNTHRNQGGRFCVLISSVCLLGGCYYYGHYWKYRCLPVDPDKLPDASGCTTTTPPNAVCCVNSCTGLSNNETLRCFKQCSEMYPNYENDLGITESLQASAGSWKQRDPEDICQTQARQQYYPAATWTGAKDPKPNKVSEFHTAVQNGCWSVGVLGFVFATLLPGLFGLLAALHTDFRLGEIIFKAVSLVFGWLYLIVGALAFSLAAYGEDYWSNTLQPKCRQMDSTPLVAKSMCLNTLPLCRMWEENRHIMLAVFVAMGIMFLLAGLTMLIGGVISALYPIVEDESDEPDQALFSPMVGGPSSIAQTMSVPQQAQRLHSTLTGRPGHLPMTYTVELPRKHMEDLYAPLGSNS